jgi:uncharacterized protein (UPF0332 family)
LPLKSEHISKAERNEKIAQTLATTMYWDWVVTILFYAALHYVDAILAVSGTHPENHTRRNDFMWTNDTLKKIRSEYRTLETLSRNARYRVIAIDSDDLHQAELIST